MSSAWKPAARSLYYTRHLARLPCQLAGGKSGSPALSPRRPYRQLCGHHLSDPFYDEASRTFGSLQVAVAMNKHPKFDDGEEIQGPGSRHACELALRNARRSRCRKASGVTRPVLPSARDLLPSHAALAFKTRRRKPFWYAYAANRSKHLATPRQLASSHCTLLFGEHRGGLSAPSIGKRSVRTNFFSICRTSRGRTQCTIRRH